jgi:NADPH:quinone reductase-like Zn-dependent oxidoreductase
VSAAALDNTDVRTREGAYGTAEDPDAPAGWLGPIAFPRIQGGDVAGVVDASGSDVAPDLVGRRVLVDSARVHDVTESPLTDQQLACLPIASGTAMGSSCAARGALRAREHFPSL